MRRMTRIGVALLAASLAFALAAAAAWATTGANGWGDNSLGQVGAGPGTGNRVLSPTVVKGITGVELIAAGYFGSLAKAEGKLWSWGSNAAGQLGNETEPVSGESDEPVLVSGKLEGVEAISVGDDFDLALKGGHVWAWGLNAQGQLGTGSTVGPEVCTVKFLSCSKKPLEVSGLSGVVAIAAGDGFSMALLENGHIKVWGQNDHGQLGIGSTGGAAKCKIGETEGLNCETTPTEVEGITKAVKIAAGAAEGAAVIEGGTVNDWGQNEKGQLGNGTTTSSNKPVEVSELTNATSVAVGNKTVVALLSTEKVKSWGWNNAGALGAKKTESELEHSTTPVEVFALGGVTAIATGGSHSIALLSSEALEGWGQNTSGEVGNGTTATQISPVAVSNSKEVAGIAAGAEHSLSRGAAGPVIVEISPVRGEIGGHTVVKIKGSGFNEVSAVKFGTLNALSFTVVSSTLIEAETPEAPTGNVRVTVTAARGSSDANVKFTYVPEETIDFGRCLKASPEKTGLFKNSNCTEKTTGANWEWHSGMFEKPGFSETGGEVNLETVGKSKIHCTESRMTGEYTGPQSLTISSFKWTGCYEKEEAIKCSTTGASTGEVLVTAQEGILGFESKELNNAGLQTQQFAGTEFSCGTTPWTVKGAAVGVLTPVNNMKSAWTLRYKQSKGKQKPEKLEKGPTAILEVSTNGGTSYEHAGLEAFMNISNEEEVEINTVV